MASETDNNQHEHEGEQNHYVGTVEGNSFTGSSLASLAPRNTYVTYQEVLDADKKFFDLVQQKKTKEVRDLIHKYNGK